MIEIHKVVLTGKQRQEMQRYWDLANLLYCMISCITLLKGVDLNM